MKRLFWAALLAAIAIALSLGVLAADGQESSGESLEGKTLMILGDSYSAGHGLLGSQKSWPELLAEDYGMELINEAISGSTLASGVRASNPMVWRCMELPEEPVDILFIQGGSNDWSRGIPLGERDQRDENTFMGALNLILDQMEEDHPEATLVCFTPWVSNGATNELGLETAHYTEAMIKVCRHRGILCYDASNTVQNNIHMDSLAFRTKYCLTPNDRWHLNAGGQLLFAPAISRWLQENLCGVTTADRFRDMAGTEYNLKIHVSRVYEQGVMYGTTDTLFSPGQLATRRDLATTLYRIAGAPWVAGGRFSDISSDDPDYAAVSWAVEWGLLESDGCVYPDQALRRQELLEATYTLYELSGGQVRKTQGIGSYLDRDQIPDEWVIPWGWGLEMGLLEDMAPRLAPESLVSRGQLAIALSHLMEEL